jgi:hypothetical protein
MESTKTLATAFAVTVAVALSGLQSSVAQPGASFQNQGIREVPRPDQSLLEPQPPPDCAFKGPLSNPPTAEETRMKLDYEQQCYRQSEMIVRTRLEQLQKSIEEATKPTSRRPVEKAPMPTSRRELKGERHTFVRHASSGNHRTSDHPVVWTTSYPGYPALGGSYYRYRYFGCGYTYWRPRPMPRFGA